MGWVAHVGDSTACIAKRSGGDKREMLVLTEDHKPELESERVHIEKSGGRIDFDGQNHRVRGKETAYPGINLSRSHGDVFGHNNTGLSAEPHIQEYYIDSEDEVLTICSD